MTGAGGSDILKLKVHLHKSLGKEDLKGHMSVNIQRREKQVLNANNKIIKCMESTISAAVCCKCICHLRLNRCSERLFSDPQKS